MVQIIAGKKGKGKTKHLLDMANAAIKGANGTVVYLDKSAQHMYELNNKIRLVDATTFPLVNSDEFLGFICGVISQDHDLEQMYLDSFLKIAHLEGEDVAPALDKLAKISEQFQVNFVISISLTRDQLPDSMKENVIAEL